MLYKLQKGPGNTYTGNRMYVAKQNTLAFTRHPSVAMQQKIILAIKPHTHTPQNV